MNVANASIAALLEVIDFILGLYVWVLVIGAVLSWLAAFSIINTNNRLIQMVGDFIYRITEPVLLVLIFIIFFLQSFIRHLAV
jgi:uncharacterized protein YggT (Ycf19 family)